MRQQRAALAAEDAGNRSALGAGEAAGADGQGIVGGGEELRRGEDEERVDVVHSATLHTARSAPAVAMAAEPTASALTDVRSVAIAILCAPQLRPGAAPAPPHAKRACEQDLPAGVALTEVLVLDDGPLRTRRRTSRRRCRTARRGACGCAVSVPPDASGRVSMRLKRNVALLLASADALCFFDDDDWRARDSVAPVAVLGDADVCTLQVLARVRARRLAPHRAVLGLADGGSIFSRRLAGRCCFGGGQQRTPTSAFRRRRARTSTSWAAHRRAALDGHRGAAARTLVDAESRRSKMMTVRLLGLRTSGRCRRSRCRR